MKKLLISIIALAICTAAASPESIALQKRQAKVIRLLMAIKGGDRQAFNREQAQNIPYYLGHDEPKRQTSSPFGIRSLAQFYSCKHYAPSMTGFDWVTVQWDCPDGVQLPWKSTSTAFKFHGLSIVEIRTTPGAPILFP